MQISATTPIQPALPIDRTDSGPQAQPQAQDALAKLKAVDQTLTAPKVFTPAPPLRPNVQDFVDIDRTLIELRTGP